MRVAIVGNCQARPLAEILTAIFDVEVSTSVIVHLVRPQDEPLHRPGLQSADVILAQRVAENYPTPFVRTEALHAEHGAKVQVWQNLYFAGYNPELRYCKRSGKGRGRLGGPLGEYHLEPLMLAWREGLDIASAVERLGDVDWHRARYAGAFGATMQELQARERRGGIPVSDLIAEHWTRRRLFFTFNHPSSALLVPYALRVGKALGWKPVRKLHPVHFGEPLSGLILPVNPLVHAEHGLAFGNVVAYRGARVKTAEGGAPFSLQTPMYYRADELVQAFWRVYDAQPDDLEA